MYVCMYVCKYMHVCVQFIRGCNSGAPHRDLPPIGCCPSPSPTLDGTVAVWGSNLYGQLGQGSAVRRGDPVVGGRDGCCAVVKATILNSLRDRDSEKHSYALSLLWEK